MSIFRRATYDYASQIGMQAVSLVVGIAIARMFDAQGKGLWQAVMMAAAVGTSFGNFGSRAANQYVVGKDGARASQAHGVTILLVVLSTLACYLVAYLIPSLIRARSLSEDITDLLIWAALVLPLMLYHYGWGGILIGLGRIAQLARFNFFLQVAQAGLWILVLLLGGGIEQLLAAWAACWTGAVGFMIFLLRDYPPKFSGGLTLMKENLAYGLTAFSGNFASNVMRYFNKAVMLTFGNVSLFSVFTTADTYAVKFFLHPEALEKASFASVTATTRSDAVRLVCRLVRLSLAMGLVVWACGGVLASILLYLNGPEFVSGIPALWALMAGPIAVSGSRMIAMYFSGQLGVPRIPSMLAWVGAGLNVALVYLGVRTGGIFGAAVGTSLSYILHFALYIAWFRKHLKAEGIALRYLLVPQFSDLVLVRSYFRRSGENR